MQMITPLLIIKAVIIGASIWFSWRLANEDQDGCGAFVIKLSCLAVTLASFALLMTQSAQAAHAPLKPSSRPPLSFLNNNAAQLDGPINFKCFAALEHTLKAYPDLKMLVLNSPGGRIPAARGLVRLIGEAKLATHVDTLCASACTLAFIAGQSRTLSRSAQLGFHGYKLNSSIVTLNIAEEKARDRAFFIANGLSQNFAQRAFKTPHNEMWFPSYETLVDAGALSP